MRLALQNSIPAFRKIGSGSSGLLNFSGVTDIYAYGDSYTSPGLHATGGGTPAANAYLPKLLAVIGKGVTNRADTGTGILHQVYHTLFSDVQPRVRGITMMAGLNDVNRNGNGAAFLAFWKQFYKVFLVSNLIVSGQAASDSIASGWNAYNHQSGYHKARQFGGGKTPKLVQSLYPTSGELSYSFSGDHIVLGYFISSTISNPSTFLDTMEIRIDGALVDTINCHVNMDQDLPNWEAFSDYFPRVAIYSGLSSGSHTITVRRTANSGGINGGIVIDYFGHLGTDTSDTKPILLGHVTYIPNYIQAAPYVNGSDAAVDDMNQTIDDLVSEIKAVKQNLPVAVMRTNEDLPAIVQGTDFHADGIHLIDPGHDKFKDKFLGRISAF